MLYLVATPIGNLADITYRALEVLKKCDYILCEDTRRARILLDHYEIKKPLKSFHLFNEKEEEEGVVADLKNGKEIALISDAGTPGISDPGHALSLRCQEEKIPYTVLPGACCVVAALTLSALTPLPFQFVGFLPKKKPDLKAFLHNIFSYLGTTVAFETPHRLLETLELLEQIEGKRKLAVVRELTKIYEEALTGTATELKNHFIQNPPKGEIVLLFAPQIADYSSQLFPEEEVEDLQTRLNLSLSDAIKTVASLRKIPKRVLYQKWHTRTDSIRDD